MSTPDAPESYVEAPDVMAYEDALTWEPVAVPVSGSPRVRTHELKVVPPYFDAIVSGAKPFEVRRNDRGYQRGDVLRLREWHPASPMGRPCQVDGCDAYSGDGAHYSTCAETAIRRVSFVYSGDPRFGGVEQGFVVLGLEPVR